MLIFAHRGASGSCPENTMSAFEKAISQKAGGIELDVRLTKDGVPVVCHDSTINRTSNGKGHIHNFTLSELKAFDFGSWYSSDFCGEAIPTLEEVLQIVKESDITLNIELKNGPYMPDDLEEKTLKLVHKHQFQNNVIVSSFDHHSLQKLRVLDSSIKIGFILHMNLINLFDYIENSRINPYSIHPNYFYVTEEMMRKANESGIKVFPYTINDVQTALNYMKRGVAGIITNEPEAINNAFHSQGSI